MKVAYVTLRNSVEIRKRIIKDFMDLIILRELESGASRSGYDIIILFRKKFQMSLSPGSLYSMLYAMERKGLIESTVNDEKKVYALAGKGKEKIRNTRRDLDPILSFMKSILGEKNISKLA